MPTFVWDQSSRKLIERHTESFNNLISLTEKDQTQTNNNLDSWSHGRKTSSLSFLVQHVPDIIIPIVATAYPILLRMSDVFVAYAPAVMTAMEGGGSIGGVGSSSSLHSTPTGDTPFSDSMWPLIRMLQDFALPVGVGVALWGLIECMLENENGKKRVKTAFVAYVAVFIVPVIFRRLQKSFMNMGWD